ncbi:unnamed protein product [Paramecium octaurelia]|uniref:RING-type domain-containing protein n=1 Tax=Paramecium octaurelia TaxID=43137 RepID=A0A8S1YG74_PAROT|nr:unnamed protein product [Paramecium octaurelia]
MILILLLYSIVVRAQKLLKTLELDVNNKISGIINVEKNDENLLIVFQFDKSTYPIAIVSEEQISDSDFNTTIKPIFIESSKVVFFDYESIQTHQSIHIVEIKYMENIYYYVKDRFGPFKLKIQVYSKPHSICINNCQGFQVNSMKQSSRCSTKCECQFGYFGSYCQFELINIEQDVNYKIHLIPHKAVYLSFQLEQEAILIADDVIDPITASFGVQGKKGFEIPDQTSYTAILHSQLSLTKLIQNLKLQFKDAKILIIGLYCRTDQTINVVLKQEQTPSIWSGNCLFLAFASFNIIVIILCFGITNLCRQKEITVKKKRKIKIRPPKIEDPKNFSGSFFNKYFEIYEYDDFIQINPQYNQNTQCVVCMEDLNQKEISITPCGHIFHYQCLKKWLMRILNCPSCRFQITYQQVIEGGWLGSKLSQNPLCQQSSCQSHSGIQRSNSFIENNENADNVQMVEKGDENCKCINKEF